MSVRAEIQAATPIERIEALADALGLDRLGGDLRCPSPDHDDGRRSAGIFGVSASVYYGSPAHGRWKCHGCDAGGDALELVMVARPDWGNVKAEAWIRKQIEQNPDLPSSPTGSAKSTKPFDPTVARQARRNEQDAIELATDLFTGKGLDTASVPWVVRRWHLGGIHWRGQWRLVMPYLRCSGGDGKLEIVQAKHRYAEVAEAGGPAGIVTKWTKRIYGELPTDGMLFGEQLDRSQRTVVIAEGETDALALDVWLRRDAVRERVFGTEEPVLVLGWVNAGALPTDRLVGLLAGRRVVLVPDRDDKDGAGFRCADRWSARLVHEPRTRVCVASLPHGEDVASAGRTAALGALRNARDYSNRGAPEVPCSAESSFARRKRGVP